MIFCLLFFSFLHCPVVVPSASEDPFLGATLIQPLVKGLQSQTVIATVKHFINNNQDYHRYDIDEHLDERTLMEIYMPTFLAGAEAGAGAAMVLSTTIVPPVGRPF